VIMRSLALYAAIVTQPTYGGGARLIHGERMYVMNLAVGCRNLQ
jgi:hypothetical protein